MKVLVIQYNHDQPLVSTTERYNHWRLLLQRDILALHSWEAKARYNTVQDFSKILLLEAWLTKIPYNELWDSIYSKVWGDPWHSPFWLFIYPHESSPTTWLLHPNINTWTFTVPDITLQCTCTHVGWNRLKQAMQDITKTQTYVGWPTLRRPHGGWPWRTDAKLSGLWWCPSTQWWHPVESELLPPLHLGTLIWLLYPTRSIACTWSSRVRPNRQHTNA